MKPGAIQRDQAIQPCAGELEVERRLRGEIEHQYQTSWGHTLAGGTSEIQRTTIAVRALDLPAEPRARA